jgi:hypothetical protein
MLACILDWLESRCRWVIRQAAMSIEYMALGQQHGLYLFAKLVL